MSLQLNQIVPDFNIDSTEGPIRFHDWMEEDWAVLFSHPADYTPVCTTELGEASRLQPEFAARGVKLIGLSVDALEDHHGWADDIRATQGHALNFPLIADSDGVVADRYGMVHPEADAKLTVRTVFVIDPRKRLRLSFTYPPAVGRNFDEILRVVDALQTADRAQVATPVNWRPGEPVIIPPSISDERARTLFPQGWDAPRPYLRYTHLPN
ncbi:peroxidase [Acidihalobacter yilgarnensis]|uniref:Alkyl hydroperoxide reductase C n=1 Tax=Acidihalobacter yilgarnensis TaxID=2819280 RepID=A0A1D8ILW4_9GAMM|nr:peroxiredoxin [Acidihalobacter yilgarnensis]AOU97444.1 peroxidase [Acidihalobacter yilgarnensis]